MSTYTFTISIAILHICYLRW